MRNELYLTTATKLLFTNHCLLPTIMPFTVPTWIERLLGMNTEAGEGTAWSIESAWGWPPWATLLFVMVAVIFVVAIYLREGPRGSRTLSTDAGRHSAGAGCHSTTDDRPSYTVAETHWSALCGRADRRLAEHDHRRRLRVKPRTRLSSVPTLGDG